MEISILAKGRAPHRVREEAVFRPLFTFLIHCQPVRKNRIAKATQNRPKNRVLLPEKSLK
ncbi:hypothetical protein [Larkinella sp. GY13]|uniref:hypothetical protein n=1 Tax=Larkinella sp. GY13 TaxID=3453720 RepID=UPI003F6FA1D6